MKRFFYLICFLVVVTACKEVFDEPPTVMVQASFLNSITKDTISAKTTVWGAGLEYYWVKDTVLSEILFPLSSGESTRYLVSFDSKVDTITFYHQTTQKYASMESGFYNEYILHKIVYTKNRIDSIQIIDSLITKTWNENIKLYIHPLPASSN